MKWIPKSLWVLGGVGLIGAGVYFAGESVVNQKGKNDVPKLEVESKPVNRDTRFTTSFSPIIKKVAPSVVNIYTTKMVREFEPDSLPFSFFDRFFGDEFGLPRRSPEPRTREEQSLGSGVIVSEDGYILTSNHVVDQADEIRVALDSDRKVFTAKVVGADPQTDVAVLKVEGDNLPAITVADSEKLEVGDVVLAIGNPFGVGQTVTMGIVSAVGRAFGIVAYEDFIQTDASINPGNSGGALVDAEGRLVGINTAIISRTGGNQGVGFAVPINMARYIMERLITEGKVVRGFLGVTLQPLTPELAREFGVSGQNGALVTGIVPESPAAEAGFKAGDVIVELNNQKVTDTRNLRLTVARIAPGTKVQFKVLRDGKERTVSATLDEFPAQEALARPGRERSRPWSRRSGMFQGVELGELDTAVRRQFNIPSRIQGALVLDVQAGTPAYAAGLRPGDVIMEINRQPVGTVEEAIDRTQGASGDRILLRAWSQGGSRYLVLDASRARR